MTVSHSAYYRLVGHASRCRGASWHSFTVSRRCSKIGKKKKKREQSYDTFLHTQTQVLLYTSLPPPTNSELSSKNLKVVAFSHKNSIIQHPTTKKLKNTQAIASLFFWKKSIIPKATKETTVQSLKLVGFVSFWTIYRATFTGYNL